MMSRAVQTHLAGRVFETPAVGCTFFPYIFSQEKTQTRCRVFHGFGQGKFAYGGLVLDSSQYSLLPCPSITLDSKVIEIDSKITIVLR